MGKTVGNLDKYIQIDLSKFSVNGHTHSYVPLSGGTMTGNLKFSDVTSTTYPAKSAMLTWNGSTDGADIYYQVDASDKGRLVLNTRDDADCVIAFANKGTIKTTIDANGNFSGKAAKADTLNTARTLTIGNTGKTFNGSANVAWSLSEIGAAAASHNHDSIVSGGRITDANIPVTGYNKLYYYLATSSMTANKPVADGKILHFEWDNTGGWSSQLFLEHTTTPRMQIRGMSEGTWGNWINVYTSANKPTPADIGAAASSHGTHVTWSTTTPKANGTAAIGTETKVARGDHVHPLQTSVAQLTNARTLTIGSKGKSFDGSANVSWTLAEIGALPTAGGTMTGILTIGPVAYDSGYTKAGTFTDTNVKRSMIKFAAVSGSSDPGAIYLETSATTADSNKGVLHLCPSDDSSNDGTDYVSIHGTNDAENIKLHTGGNANFAGTITAPTFSGALNGNAATATKAAQLTTARTINGTSFNGTANITTANWGTARKINQISVNGSADVKLPLDYYTCSIGNSNAKPYHHILTTGQCTGDYTDKSITIVLVNHYNGAGLGIAKATLRTNQASNGATATAELRWLVRSGFSENQLCFNLRNTAKDTYMDVFYKSTGTYNSLTWYVLTEGARGSHSSQWTKYNTHHDNGTNVYDEAGMKAIRTYTSTLQSGTDHGNVNYAKSANTATSATTASGANALNKNTRMDYGWDGLNYFNISGTAGNAAKANDTPTTAWWHIIRCNHNNSAGFYTDIAVPFNATSMYYKRVTSGAVQNGGWVKVLDSLNYNSYALPLSGGTLTGNLTISDTKKIFLSNKSGHTNAAIGVDSSTGDVYISNINNNWFRVKPDKTMTIGGSKVYSAIDKPTPAEIGAEVATATHSTVDITSSGFTSKGTKTADTMASTGNCYSLASTTSSLVLASGNFNAVKFGKYALCLRIMSSNNTSTANILTVTVKHGSTTLLTKNIKGTDFTSTSQYSNIYTSFDFNGTSSARGTLSVQISTGTTSGITFKFDYAYITLMTPSVFI